MPRAQALCMLLAATLPVAAQVQRTGTASVENYLAKMDADRDGRVSLGEYQHWLGYAFEAMDRDRDGVLAPAELPGGRGQPLTRETHRAKLAQTFAKQDANRDGYLNATELAAPPR